MLQSIAAIAVRLHKVKLLKNIAAIDFKQHLAYYWALAQMLVHICCSQIAQGKTTEEDCNHRLHLQIYTSTNIWPII